MGDQSTNGWITDSEQMIYRSIIHKSIITEMFSLIPKLFHYSPRYLCGGGGDRLLLHEANRPKNSDFCVQLILATSWLITGNYVTQAYFPRLAKTFRSGPNRSFLFFPYDGQADVSRREAVLCAKIATSKLCAIFGVPLALSYRGIFSRQRWALGVVRCTWLCKALLPWVAITRLHGVMGEKFSNNFFGV